MKGKEGGRNGGWGERVGRVKSRLGEEKGRVGGGGEGER